MDLFEILICVIMGLISTIFALTQKYNAEHHKENKEFRKTHSESNAKMWDAIQEDLKEHVQDTNVHVDKTFLEVVNRRVIKKNNTGKYKPTK